MSRFVFSLLLIACLLGCSGSPEKKNPHPSVVVLLLDTLRADHLGAYGYSRDTSPHLDNFAKENSLFLNAVSAAPWTPASVASILTGLYPVSHGMMPPNDRETARNAFRLNANLDTLPELFGGAGYQTGAITPNPWMSKEFGYDQGFQSYHYLLRERADKITDNAIELVDKMSSQSKPFFLYVHYLDPHDPYDPPGEFASLYRGAVPGKFAYPEKMSNFLGKYDGEIRFMDREIGRLFAHLRAKNAWENTIIVIVGDHGEQFMEHGNHTHGFMLHSEELHVPLMLKVPGQGSRRVETTVSTVDIFPTLLSLANVVAPAEVPGVSLFDEPALLARPAVLSEIRRKYSQKSVVTPQGKKLILQVPLKEDSSDFLRSLERWKNPEVLGTYDRAVDPEELNPVQDAQAYAELRGLFEDALAKAIKARVVGGAAPAKVSDETLDQLKSLGYLQ